MSAAEQAFSTQPVMEVRKAEALQMQAISVSEHPEAPMEEMAQVRAHDGISLS